MSCMNSRSIFPIIYMIALRSRDILLEYPSNWHKCNTKRFNVVTCVFDSIFLFDKKIYSFYSILNPFVYSLEYVRFISFLRFIFSVWDFRQIFFVHFLRSMRTIRENKLISILLRIHVAKD